MDYRQLYATLRQRKTVQTVVVYVGASWGILQALSLFQQTYGWPRQVMDATLFVLAAGLLAAVTISWYHGERGHQRVTRAEMMILGLLALVAMTGGWGLATRPDAGGAGSGETAALERTVAVLPFVNTTRDSSLAWMEKGLAEMVTTDLAQKQGLRVVSGQRVFDLLKQQGVLNAAIVPEPVALKVASKAAAAYVVRGAVFRAGGSYRLDAELVRIADGTVDVSAHVVGENLFAMVDSLADRLGDAVVASSGGGAAAAAAPSGKSTGAGAALAGAAAPLAELATANLDAYRQYNLGLEAERNLRLPEAVTHYRGAVALDSTFPQALLHLGMLEMQTGAIGGALDHLMAAERYLGRSSERDRLFAEGVLAWARRDVPTAELRLEALTRRYPDEKDGWRWLAQAYGADPSRWQRREGVLRRLIELDPSYSAAYNQLAYHYGARGDLLRADSFLRRYQALEPHEPNPLDTRGEIMERAGRYEDARAAYLAALRLRPDFVVSLEHLARVGMRSGQVEQAIGDLRPFLGSSDPLVRVRATMLLGELDLWRAHVEGALARFQEATRLAEGLRAPDLREQGLAATAGVYSLLGQPRLVLRTLEPLMNGPNTQAMQYIAALGELRDFAAMAQWRERVRSFTARPGMNELLRGAVEGVDAYDAYYRGDWARAIDRFRAARAARGDGPATMLDAREVLALLNAGRAGEALPLVAPLDTAGFGEAVRRHQNLYLRGRVFEATGGTADARREYARLVADWGSSIRRFPRYADVPERLKRLGG